MSAPSTVSMLSTLRAALRTLGRVSLTPFAYLAAILLLPLLAGGLNLGVKYSALSHIRPVPALSGPLPPPTYDPAKKIAVVVASNDGAVVSDFLPTYDILARSGRFNVYVVAPQRRVVPLLGFSSTGLNVVPHFSFAGYQAAIGRAPDLIAVPYLPRYSASRDAAVLRWLRAETGPRTTVLGICSGTWIVADAGLLDGHRATTNTGLFAMLAKQHPAVRWVHDMRYVADGRRVTSTNLTAGMDATLHVIDRFAGRAVAVAVAHQIGYPTLRYLDDPRWQPGSDDSAPFGPLVANAAFRWGWERLGLVLHPGMDELSLAAWADPYTSSGAAQVYTVAPTRAPIRSRHGLYFVPDYAATNAPRFDRLLVPGGSAGQWAYAASLHDLARDQGDAAATATSRLLFLASAQRASMGFPIAPLLVAPALSLLGAGFVYGLSRLRRHLRSRRSPRAGRASRVGRVASGVARFILHFGEMVVVMYVGMFALGALNAQVLVPLVHVDLTGPTPETQALAMGVFMGLPMAAWMWLRGHGRRHSVEMAAAMIVPYALAVALHLVGLLPRAAMMEVGSDLMWLAMVGVMLSHWRHYAGASHAHGTGTPATLPPDAAPATLAPAN